MDGDNRRRAAQGQAQIPGQVMGGVAAAAAADAGTEASDWKNHLQAGPRQRIVNKITETLKRHLPFSGQEGLQQLKKIAVRFEERVYTEATSQSDYLRKISLKMLTMEIKPMNSTANSRQSSNAPINSKKPQEPASQTQMRNHVQQLPTTMVSNQSQVRQTAFIPDIHEVVTKLQQDISLKESKIEELKSKNASLEIRVSDLQARAEKDEEKHKEMTHLMSELQKTVEELHKTVKELQKNA
ncbi:hypothetical protein ABFX02_02G104800 [Erythranthe guttata]